MQKQRDNPTVWDVEFYSFIYEQSTGESLLPQQHPPTATLGHSASKLVNNRTDDAESEGSANTYDVSEEDVDEAEDDDAMSEAQWQGLIMPQWTLEGDVHKGGVVSIRHHPHISKHEVTVEQRYQHDHSQHSHHHKPHAHTHHHAREKLSDDDEDATHGER